MKVQLTHVCNAKEYAGNPGDIVDVPDDLAQVWFKSGGAKPAPAEAKEKPVKGDAKEKPVK